VLLQLIERQQLDITKVALAQVTDQYLEHLNLLPQRRLSDLAEFLVIAAKLLQIKSEALLPAPPPREEGEEDPGEALARQLLLYRQFKQAAGSLESRAEAGLRTYLRTAAPPAIAPELDLAGIGPNSLLEAMLEALSALDETASLEGDTEPPVIAIDDKIAAIVQALGERESISFQSILQGAASRLEVVVLFLAVLQLIKSNRVLAVQERLFAEITLTRGPTFYEGE
jgi:segregation and condensation protein A